MAATILILLLMIVPSAIVRGFVLMKMWLWFIVPLGVNAISITHAIGLATLAGLLTHQSTGKELEKDQGKLIGSAIGEGFLAPLLILLMGYVIKSFM